MDNKTSLKLYSIEISNYRQYYGKTKINLSLDEKKTFTIIQGSMGAGKTSLFNAISWCLYGLEKQTKKLEGLPIINTRVLKETPVGNFLDMEVTLKIGTADVVLYQISRMLRCHKNSEDLTIEKQEGVLLPKGLEPRLIKRFMKWSESAGWEEDEYFDTAVSQLLPKELSDFFLFDGEELVKFFDEGLAKVKDGIEVISQISLTQQAIGHLENMALRYRGQTRGYDSSADAILEQINQTTQFRDQQQREYNDLEKQSKPLENRLSEIADELRSSARDVIREKQRLRDQLESQKSTLYKDINEINAQRISKIISWAPQVYLTGALKTAIALLHKAIQEKLLPPPIDIEYCKSLLDHGQCICGADISVGKGRQNVANLLNRANLSEVYPIANTGTVFLPGVLRDSKNNLDELNGYQQKIEEKERGVESIQRQLKEISTQLKNFDEENIRTLESEHDAKKNWLKDLNDRMVVLSSDVARANREIERLSKEHNSKIQKNVKLLTIQKQMSFCSDAALLLKRIQQDLVNQVRATVQSKTEKYFLSIIWKKGTFTGLTIDERYRIAVMHIDGFNATGSLSAGETLYLALSFIAALREITGFRFPIVIDTPLGRVSGKPRILAAEHLPNYIPGTQITMLVTDTEYASPVIDEETKESIGSFRDKVQKNVAFEYKLSYDEKERKTSVVPYNA